MKRKNERSGEWSTRRCTLKTGSYDISDLICEKMFRRKKIWWFSKRNGSFQIKYRHIAITKNILILYTHTNIRLIIFSIIEEHSKTNIFYHISITSIFNSFYVIILIIAETDQLQGLWHNNWTFTFKQRSFQILIYISFRYNGTHDSHSRRIIDTYST